MKLQQVFNDQQKRITGVVYCTPHDQQTQTTNIDGLLYTLNSLTGGSTKISKRGALMFTSR